MTNQRLIKSLSGLGGGLVLALVFYAVFTFGSQQGKLACAQTCEPTPTIVPTPTPVPTPTLTPTPMPTPTPTPPGSLTLLGRWDGSSNSYSNVWAEGNYAYIGHHYNFSGVDIIDISNPTNPVKVANFGAGFTDVWNPVVRNGVLYTTSLLGGTGIYIVDVSNPTSPVQLAHLSIGKTYHVSFSGNVMYVVDDTTLVVKMFDVSSPNTPMFLGSFTAPGNKIHTAWVRGNRLLLSSWNQTSIWDVTVPETPVMLGTYVWGYYQHSADLDGSGRYMYVAFENLSCPGGGQSYVKVVDISDPSHLVVVNTISLVSGSGGVTPHYTFVDGNTLWVSWMTLGVKKFDIIDPTNPILVGGFDTTFGVGGTCVDDGNWGVFPLGNGRVLASDWKSGLLVLE